MYKYLLYMHDDSEFLEAKERAGKIKCHLDSQVGEEAGRKNLEMRCRRPNGVEDKE